MPTKTYRFPVANARVVYFIRRAWGWLVNFHSDSQGPQYAARQPDVAEDETHRWFTFQGALSSAVDQDTVEACIHAVTVGWPDQPQWQIDPRP